MSGRSNILSTDIAPLDAVPLDAMIDEDDVDLTDPDNPEWTEEDFARAEGPEALPYNILVQFPNTLSAVREKYEGKTAMLTLDQAVAEALINSGTGWAERANAILKKALNIEDDPPMSGTAA